MERPTAIIIHQYIDPVRYTSVGTLNNVDADSELHEREDKSWTNE